MSNIRLKFDKNQKVLMIKNYFLLILFSYYLILKIK